MNVLAPRSRLAIEPAGFRRPAEALFAAVHDRPGAFILDSALASDGLGAFSFLGFDPFLTVQARGERLELRWRGRREPEVLAGDPLERLRELLARLRCDGGELPFAGGAVGYFSYEWGALREGIRPPGGPGWAGPGPDFEFAFHDGVVAVDEHTGEAWLAASGVHLAPAAAILERLRRELESALAHPPAQGEWRPVAGTGRRESLGRVRYLKAVERIRDYIAAGDAYQVNLTQAFEAPQTGPAHALYRRLRRRSPAPFGCCLDLPGGAIVGSSPERFLRVRGRRAETRPIKGTRPRGRTEADDARLADELRNSPKDRAELLMIVDLERNDLGRVCAFGSVEVEENFRLERHPTVHHLVAQVAGELRPEVDALACAAALSPGGSITGAPKVRAMQIIAELEACPRGPYTGAVGYLGFDGHCDFNVGIRTLVLRDGRVRYHAGGGVVWDSEPEAEYEEMRLKARALAEAVGDPQP